MLSTVLVEGWWVIYGSDSISRRCFHDIHQLLEPGKCNYINELQDILIHKISNFQKIFQTTLVVKRIEFSSDW